MTDEEELDQEMLRALAKQTAALPREIAPPVNAWDRIREEIQSGRPGSSRDADRAARWWQRPQLLIAAGVALVAATSYITSAIVQRRMNDPATMAVSASRTQGSNQQSLAQFTALENNYIETANRFTQILDSQQNDLAPETVAKLKESVRVIDGAILEARRALAADPSNEALMEMLMASYSQKVDLLKRTTEMGQS
jgi:hypothetical protein